MRMASCLINRDIVTVDAKTLIVIVLDCAHPIVYTSAMRTTL